MSDILIKQLIFDCAVELLHETEELSKEEIANKLFNIVKLLDKNNEQHEQEVIVLKETILPN